MSYLLKKLFIVFIIILLFDLLIGKTLEYFYYRQTSGLLYRTTYSMDSTTADILIFGSSRANHHYVPEILEDSLKMFYYNTGRDGSGIFYQLAVLKSILKRHNPKIVILDYYDVLEFNQSDYDRLSSLLPYYKRHIEIQDIVNKRSSFEMVKLLSSTYPYNSLLTTIMVGNFDMNKKRKSDNKGYVPLYSEWKLDLKTVESIPKLSLDVNKKNSFIEFIDLCRKSEIKVYVVYSPIFMLHADEEEISIAKKLCKERNVDFLDFSKDNFFLSRPDFFQDITHLNHKGAITFTNQVLTKIKR